MRRKRTGEELGMELRAQEKRVLVARELGNLHQRAVGRCAGKHESAVL